MRNLLFASFSLAGSLFVMLTVPCMQPVGSWADSVIYMRMARQPTHFSFGHWGFRILTPWIVHLLPFPYEYGFTIITFVGLCGTAFVLSWLCNNMGMKTRTCLLAAWFFLISFPTTFFFLDRAQVDPLTYLGTTLLFVCFAYNAPRMAVMCLVLTTLNKEWGLFLLAPYTAWTLLRKHPQFIDALVGIVATIFTYWSVRHLPNFGMGDYNDNLGKIVADIKGEKEGHLWQEVIGTFGALPLLSILGVWKLNRTLSLSLLLIPAVILQWIDAGGWTYDQRRMLSYAFICVIPSAAAIFDNLSISSFFISAILISYTLFLSSFQVFPFGYRESIIATLIEGWYSWFKSHFLYNSSFLSWFTLSTFSQPQAAYIMVGIVLVLLSQNTVRDLIEMRFAKSQDSHATVGLASHLVTELIKMTSRLFGYKRCGIAGPAFAETAPADKPESSKTNTKVP